MSALVKPEGKNKAYEILLRRERRVKPASVTYRHQLLRNINRTNYQNEYDRLTGELDGYKNVFSRPGSPATIEAIEKRQAVLRKMFHDEAHDQRHPIYNFNPNDYVKK
jgi:hypothetical protein